MTTGPCKNCGHDIARNQGYVLVPTPWGVDTRHKDGECITPAKR